MKRFIAFLLSVCMVTAIFIGTLSYAVESELYEKEGLINCQTASYVDNNYYRGKKITNPHIDVKKFATLDIISDGGSHIDGDGNAVFSNYVLFSIFLNFDKSSKYILGTDVKVSEDSCDWNDMDRENGYKYGNEETDTEKPISYGAIVVTRTDGDGNVFKYAPIFSTGNNSLEQQLFNEDGDYTVYVFFETVKNGKCQNHILSWSFKIRTSIYLLDKTSPDMHVKDVGISGNAVIIDTANREGVTVDIYHNGQSREFEKELDEPGQYKIVVKNKGFICEVINFQIDTEDVNKKVFFSNLKRRIGYNSYEAEGYFSFEWDENALSPVVSAKYAFCDGTGKDLTNNSEQKFSDYTDYEMGTELNQPGIYEIVVVDKKNQKGKYYITVTDMDNPSDNYEKLSSNRFNTFKTKWWQVYDETTGRYMCFDFDTEYDRAYNAAMTVANSTVVSGSGRYFFKGKWYNDRIELTTAMNEYVFVHNLSVFYYDPADYFDNEESKRTFSSKAFDGMIYLNDDFQFVSAHPSEVDKVVLEDADGNVYDIDFFVSISKQEKNVINDGVYTVTETDKYGNETKYTAYRDKSAPEITINKDGEEIKIEDGNVYTASYFSVSSFLDKYDNYAVLKIENSSDYRYYYRTEYEGIVFDDNGEYKVSAYDRNGNTVEFKVNIA